jgi:hypothetical protein
MWLYRLDDRPQGNSQAIAPVFFLSGDRSSCDGTFFLKVNRFNLSQWDNAQKKFLLASWFVSQTRGIRNRLRETCGLELRISGILKEKAATHGPLRFLFSDAVAAESS